MKCYLFINKFIVKHISLGDFGIYLKWDRYIYKILYHVPLKLFALVRKLHTHTNVLVSILLSFQLIIAPAVGKIVDRIRMKGSITMSY